MRLTLPLRAVTAALSLILFLLLPSRVLAYSPNPDLTVAGAIATLKADSDSSPVYSDTYNLGPTGLRGWIYNAHDNVWRDGIQTDQSRQILVTVASTPGSAVLAVDDVILGAIAADSGSVPVFSSDCRKAFGAAITDAEKTGAGTLRVKRWRDGTTTDVNIPMTIMGDYSSTAPYDCPKSEAILAAARIQLVSELIADPNFLTTDWKGSISGLALLAGVAPGDADYATVQSRLQSFAQTLASQTPNPSGLYTWDWAYITLFLSEYYLETGDDGALPGVNAFTVALAKAQSRYGTFGHDGVLKDDGGLAFDRGGYGAVNSAGIAANIGIVVGKKALLAGGQIIDPEIDTAIQQGADYFASYVNRGSIPYGEHEPWMTHDSNGKNPMCAVLFGLQDSRLAETEYFARMTIAGYPGRESGHTGPGFSYLWEALAANMGGADAVAKYLQQVRWHLDLTRRTNGSFVFDDSENFGASKTADGTYLGDTGYYGLNPTAIYILSYALPLQRLNITGKNVDPVPLLDSNKVDNALAAATYHLDCPAHTTTELIAALSEFDPLVRDSAAIELATRTLTGTEINTLLAMVTDPDANARMGACQALGLLENSTALPMLAARLSDPVHWVRTKAAEALRSYSPAEASTQITAMLTAYTANATDPEGVVWDDPIQTANSILSFALFGNSVYGGTNLASYTINAPENLLYPAIRTGIKQPDSMPRFGAAEFCLNYLDLAIVQDLTLDLYELANTQSQADVMWAKQARAAGVKTVAKFEAEEGIALALNVLDVPVELSWGKSELQNAALNELADYGDAARWTLPTLRGYLNIWEPSSSEFSTLIKTIESIETAITSPVGINNLAPVADSQVVIVSGPQSVTLTGSSCRDESVSFTLLSQPAHGTLSGTAPNLLYTPDPDASGPDHFTFQTADTLTVSEPGTVSFIVGTPGTGLKGEYYDNMDFTDLKLTETAPQVDFDWGAGSPHGSIESDTFSARWSGFLLVPESGTYTFSTLNSDGVRLYANGVPLIDDFVDQEAGWNDGVAVNLTKGEMVDLQMHYYENTDSAVAKLKWTGPSFAGANGLLIAQEWLSNGTETLTPYAYAQSVTMVQNTSKPITLTGSGGETPDVLIYTIATQPAHGTLSGTAPNLTYTPSMNFNGTDDFTFLVNNGEGDSVPATVSIAILAGQAEAYFWDDAVSGNWSNASSWTDADGVPATPATTGKANYVLNFDQAGNYTATQDLDDGFLFNQLNIAGTVSFDGTNSLSFASNGPALPQINQNSNSVVTFNAPLVLAANTTIGGIHGGQVNLASSISGPGSLTKDSPGMLKIEENNTYSGGTTVNNGTLRVDYPAQTSGLGSGPVTLNGGTLYLWRVTVDNSLTINGGSVYSSNGFGNIWNGPITLNADFNCENQYNFTSTNTISGVGGVNKSGENKLIFSGTNSYTGPTNVMAGTLQCDNPDALGNGDLSISAAAMVDLNFSGTKTIASLTLDGVFMTNSGTYGSHTSDATYKSTFFNGSGTVTVVVTPFETWALDLAQGLTYNVNDGSLHDPDSDGINNLMEFVLGGHPLMPSSAPLPTASQDSSEAWIFEYERSNGSKPPATTQIVQYGNDLVGWTSVPIPLSSEGSVTITSGNTSDHVSVVIPDTGISLFVRLKVSE
jgi:autotransporter-associated beta strand protein